MKKFLLILLVICLLLISIIIGGCSDMQSKTITVTKNNYPNRPITIIVPFSAGGGLDLFARSLEKIAPKYLGQPLVVVNKPGGGGTLGWDELVNANPDGYTLGISAVDVLMHPLYGAKYHYPSALEPIAQATTLPFVMVVPASEPWQDVNSLINYAKQHPGQLKFGHAGIGSPGHIIGESFTKTANISLEQVPFHGGSDVTISLLGSHIQIGFVPPLTVKEQIKAGTLRALATTGEQRLTDPDLAQIPTFKEQGFDIVFNSWYGIATPKELPPEIKAKLEEGFKAMIADPEFKTNIENLGLQVEYLNSDDSKDKWRSDGAELAKTIQETGILEKIKAQKN